MKIRRFFSMVLTIVMVCSVFGGGGLTAFAGETKGDVPYVSQGHEINEAGQDTRYVPFCLPFCLADGDDELAGLLRDARNDEEDIGGGAGGLAAGAPGNPGDGGNVDQGGSGSLEQSSDPGDDSGDGEYAEEAPVIASEAKQSSDVEEPVEDEGDEGLNGDGGFADPEGPIDDGGLPAPAEEDGLSALDGGGIVALAGPTIEIVNPGDWAANAPSNAIYLYDGDWLAISSAAGSPGFPVTISVAPDATAEISTDNFGFSYSNLRISMGAGAELTIENLNLANNSNTLLLMNPGATLNVSEKCIIGSANISTPTIRMFHQSTIAVLAHSSLQIESINTNAFYIYGTVNFDIDATGDLSAVGPGAVIYPDLTNSDWEDVIINKYGAGPMTIESNNSGYAVHCKELNVDAGTLSTTGGIMMGNAYFDGIINVESGAILDADSATSLSIVANADLAVNCDGQITAQGNNYGIYTNYALSLDGSGSITAGETVNYLTYRAIYTPGSIQIGDDVTLKIITNVANGDEYAFEPLNTGGGYRWGLSGNAALSSGKLSDAVIGLTVAAGAPGGTIERVPEASGAPVITSVGSYSCATNIGGSVNLTASGTGTINWSLAGAPAGVSISSGGTLTVASTSPVVPKGVYKFTVIANNTLVTDAQAFTLTVISDVPIITSASDYACATGVGGSFELTAEGVTPITWAFSTPPTEAGISIENGNILTVASTAPAGTHYFFITASNDYGTTSPLYFTLRIITPVVIDISTLGASDQLNSATPEQAQWWYHASGSYLGLNTMYGEYTLVGSNGDLYVTSAMGGVINLTLKDVSITSSIASNVVSISNADSNITLVGDNTITGNSSTRGFFAGYGRACTIKGSGSLNITATGHRALEIGTNSSLSIEEGAAITAVSNTTDAIYCMDYSRIHIGAGATLSATGDNGISTSVNTVELNCDGVASITGQAHGITYGSLVFSGSGTIDVAGGAAGGGYHAFSGSTAIRMDDNITLKMKNNDTSSYEAHNFTKSGATYTHQWKLSGDATLSSGALTDATIGVTLAAGAAGTVGREPIPLFIDGPAAMALAVGYAATFTDVFTISGAQPVTVTKVKGNAAITWNGATKKLDIAAGLAAGTYPVVLQAHNGLLPDTIFTFTLTVAPPAAPSISGPTAMTLAAGYSATSSAVFTAIGPPPPAITKASGNPAITWNDTTRRLDIAAGLVAGSYTVVLDASNGVQPNATITFTLAVTGPPAITSADNYTCTEGAGGTFPLEATGYPAPSWILSGTPPAGVSIGGGFLNVAASVPAGKYTFGLVASNGISPNATQAFTLTVTRHTAVIDVSVFDSTPASNISDTWILSKWNYNEAYRILYLGTNLGTDGGDYRLTGTNANLTIMVTTSHNTSVTLDGVDVTASTVSGASGNAFQTSQDGCTISLIGANKLTGFNNSAGIASITGSTTTTITSASGGSLEVSRIYIASSDVLNIDGNADVTTIGAGSNYGLQVGSPYTIKIGDNARLTFGNAAGTETRTFQKADALSEYRWKLTDATLSSGYELTDQAIEVTVAAGGAGTVEREPVVLVSKITVTGAGGATAITTAGGTLQMSAEALPAGASNSVTWSVTGGTGNASIDSAGLLTALANGTVTVRATANDGSGVFGQLAVSISGQPTVTGVYVSPAAATVKQGGTQTFEAQVMGANSPNPAVAWSVEGASGAGTMIMSDGTLLVDPAETAGTILTVRATSVQDGSVSGTAEVTVVLIDALEKLTIDTAVLPLVNRTITLPVGDSEPLTAVLDPSVTSQTNIEWTSNNPAVASVGSALDPVPGLVEAVSPGSAAIEVRSQDNPKIYDYIWVKVIDPAPAPAPPFTISIGGSDVTNTELSEPFAKNKTISLEASALVTWKSSDAKVATINTKGVVKFIAPGIATITATATGKDGVKKGSKAAVTIIIEDNVPRLPVKAITLYSLSDGTEFAVLPTATFGFDDIEVASATLAGKNKELKDNFILSQTGATTYKIESNGAAKGKYNVWLQALNGGADIGDRFKLTVTVDTGVPKATVKMPSLKTFWKGASGRITITGKSLPKVAKVVLKDSGKLADGRVTENFTVTQDGLITAVNAYTNFTDAKKTKPAVKGVLEIYYEGFGANCQKVNVTVKVSNTAPKLKLSPSTQTVNTKEADLSATFGLSGGVIDKVEKIDGVSANKAIKSVTNTAGGFTVTLDKSAAKAKNALQLAVWLEGANKRIVVKPTVKTTAAAATYKLSATTVTLSSALAAQSRIVTINPSAANAPITLVEITDITVPPVIGGVTVVSNPLDPLKRELVVEAPHLPPAPAGNYKFSVKVNGVKTLTLTVKVVAAAPVVSVKADKNKINLMDRGHTMFAYAPTIKNTSSAIIAVDATPAYSNNLPVAGNEIAGYEKFDAVWNAATGKAEVRAKPGEVFQKGASYKLRLEFDLGDGNRVYTNNLTVKPTQSAVKFSLPKSVVMYQGRAGVENHVVVDLKPKTPAGAKIARIGFKPEKLDKNGNIAKHVNNPNNAYWYFFDYEAQELHIWIKDSALAKPGKATLVFNAEYAGQGVENLGTKAAPDFKPKPANIKLKVNVTR